MAELKYYIKDGDEKYVLIPNGINTPLVNSLELSFLADNKSFDTVKESFSDKEEIIVYVCIVQEDGRETDETVSNIFTGYTFLQRLEYDLENDIYKLTLIIPDETQARLSELEDAVNFLLMGGE